MTPNKKSKNNPVLKVVDSPAIQLESKYFSKKSFLILSVIILFIMSYMSFDSGINGDERYRAGYGVKVFNYYKTFGKDTAALNLPENLHHLGGMFDLTATAIDYAMGLDNQYDKRYHYVRHLMCAFFGFLAIFFTGLFAKEIGGWRTGIIAMLLLFLSPRFLGDSIMNPQDIPFAAGSIISLYYILRSIKELPKPRWSTLAGLTIGIALSINILSGGMLNIVYLFFFAGISYIQTYSIKAVMDFGKLFNYLKYLLIAAVVGYFAGVLFWPFGLQNPILHPYEVLKAQTNIYISIRQLFNGEHIISSEVPWYYIPKWMGITIPLFVFAGVILLLIFSARLIRKQKDIALFILLFAFLFPIVYTIIRHSTLYDGWRHLTFTYPPLVILAAVAWNELFDSLKKKSTKIAVLIISLLLFIEPVFSIVKMHPYQCVYFNPLTGGLKGAYGKYETDYWMLSVKSAAEWLIKAENLDQKNNTAQKIKVITNCIYPALCYLDKYKDHVETGYTRFYERSEKDWDYAIFYSRFIDKSQLKNKSWVLKKNVWTVERGGVPLAVVVKREDKSDYYGFQSLKKNDFNLAIKYFTQAVNYDSRNEQTYIGLAQAYLNTNQPDLAQDALQKSLNIYPDNAMPLNMLGVIYLRKQEYDRAILTFDKLIKLNPGFDYAYLNTGVAYAQKGDLDNAIRYLQFATRINPNLKEAYQYLASIYQQKGDAKTAQEYMNRANSLK